MTNCSECRFVFKREDGTYYCPVNHGDVEGDEGCALSDTASPIIPQDFQDNWVHYILNAQDALFWEGVRANTIIFNGKKYGRLAEFVYRHRYQHTPTLFGMSVETDSSLPDDIDFLVGDFPNPPTSEYDKLVDENKRLREQLCQIGEILGAY